ncbi:hypothetical protein EJ05DRAFT_168472 [Pseudovirgaria hyperparasitica]|uniref:WIBG Mago-binding domain-containing protein n=1 Tax=Pseudovirgaria hyperparasitica TaxID=470096 RepID=A0A6A6VUY9_9PEZI|nr:uncharacterized protein EJ05DRAFT_168472 [Pseudovirgaria hyperparasitica]KAF2753689.1 hypothetical protein EJ05DRAFT_168472 [Pseudovirgaria hyperparasitica]
MPSEASTSEDCVSKSGIATDTQTGQRHIPSSTRADGSVRKEIRVRPGYRPPEDVEVYKNRTAEAWKNRGKGGVPGAEPVKNDNVDQSASSTKNAKRREARKKAADKAREAGLDQSLANTADHATGTAVPVVNQGEIIDAEEQRAKDAKKLAKKLRQARELKDKKDKGDQLLPEQFEKVIRINELIRQLNALGFDAEGEKKAED